MNIFLLAKFVGRILHHKFWIVCYGLKIGGVPLWRLLIHDMSKFSRAEFLPKFRVQILKEPEGREWDLAMDHHHERNAHHWQFWIRDGVPEEIPETYVREMVIDWFAAEKTYCAGLSNWLRGEFPKMRLHPKTAERVMRLLEAQGIYREEY